MEQNENLIKAEECADKAIVQLKNGETVAAAPLLIMSLESLINYYCEQAFDSPAAHTPSIAQSA